MPDINVKGLTLIGQGRHGKVYRIDENRCIKVYHKEAYMRMEYAVLKHSERFPQFPRIYECRDNYMIREFFEGPNLLEYIKRNGLTEDIAVKILEVIDAFTQLGFSRLDCRLPHLIVTKDLELKIIDPTRNMSKKCTYPRTLLRELDRLDCKEQFLQYTKALRPDYYAKWRDT